MWQTWLLFGSANGCLMVLQHGTWCLVLCCNHPDSLKFVSLKYWLQRLGKIILCKFFWKRDKKFKHLNSILLGLIRKLAWDISTKRYRTVSSFLSLVILISLVFSNPKTCWSLLSSWIFVTVFVVSSVERCLNLNWKTLILIHSPTQIIEFRCSSHFNHHRCVKSSTLDCRLLLQTCVKEWIAPSEQCDTAPPPVQQIQLWNVFALENFSQLLVVITK